MQKLLDKNIVVTAAAAGIGRARCELFVQEGATVWATDIDGEGLKSLSAQYPSINTMTVDVTDDRDIERLKNKFLIRMFCLIVPGLFITEIFLTANRMTGIFPSN